MRCMTKIEDFKTASFEKKCDLVIANSTYIMSRKIGETKVYLYNTGDFYIEVYYSSKYKKVLMINAFDCLVGLEIYAEKISLTDLGF